MKDKNNIYIDKIVDSLIELEDKENKFAGQVLSLAEIDYTAFNTWEWPQGVALFGIVKLYELTGSQKYYDILVDWFEKNYDKNTPKNINTCAPLIGVLKLYEITKEEKYKLVVEEWLDWVVNELPRTEEDGFQHSVSERDNEGELWDDTLFMTCLFVMRSGVVFQNERLIDLVSYQFNLHAKYLYDKNTGLWYHGWSFKRKDNFANALWARGNCWITIFIPEYIEILNEFNKTLEIKIAKQYLNNQIKYISKNSIVNGQLHTLLDDPTSYIEMSGTLGVLAGYLKAQRLGVLSADIELDPQITFQVLKENLDCSGYIENVSYGTPMGETLDFYREIPITPMPYGQSLALLFLIEYMQKDDV